MGWLVLPHADCFEGADWHSQGWLLCYQFVGVLEEGCGRHCGHRGPHGYIAVQHFKWSVLC